MGSARKERAATPVLLAVAALLATGAGNSGTGTVGTGSERFRQEVRNLLAPKATKGVFAGSASWLFLRSELQGAAGLGIWLAPSASAEPPATPPGVTLDSARGDAIAAVEDFAAQLRRRGLPLLFVLIPPKFEIYADLLIADADPLALALGEAQRAFLAGLGRRGIPVLDLAPLFRAERAPAAGPGAEPGAEPLYAAQDTHWSSSAARLAAQAIAARLRAAGVGAGPGLGLVEETSTRDDCGDLWGKLKPPRPPCSVLTLHSLHRPGADELAATVDRASPILLLGDSSSVVYHEAYRAGLADHLAQALGQPIDLLGVTAGGANGAREALARRENGLDGKKFVVWVVSGRLLYEYPAWKKIAVAGEAGAQ